MNIRARLFLNFAPKLKRLSLFSVGALLLTGCAGGGGGSGSNPTGFDGSYQSSAISALQEFQNVSYYTSGGSVLTNTVHPYDLTGVTVAYGYGLSGKGKTIAVLDTGFNSVTSFTSGTAFAEMQSKRDAGKLVINGSLSESSNNHGNVVASLAAAGLDNQGYTYFENVTGSAYPTFVNNSFDKLNHGMHGVAYDASLHLSEFDNGGMTNYTSATNRARSAGAIVQNNSWGLPSSPGNINTTALTIPPSYTSAVAEMTSTDASAWLGSTTPYSASEWQNYYTALKGFQSGGVVVFALLNQTASSRASLMAALPSIYPDLGNAWIAVGNVNVSGNTVTRRSAKCLEAAPYCLMADGTEVTGAGVQNLEGYAIGRSGSSFATPQVSGMIALLAEAFPTLSPQDLTTRLLATANNRFFSPTAERTFTGGVSHGFNEEYGHGIPDMAAALQPISTSDRPTGIVLLGSAMLGERIPIASTSLNAGGALGHALHTSLGQRELIAYDALGAGFRFPISGLIQGQDRSPFTLQQQLSRFSGYLQTTKKEAIALPLHWNPSNQFDQTYSASGFFSVGQSLMAMSQFSSSIGERSATEEVPDIWASRVGAGFIGTPVSMAIGLKPSAKSSILAYTLNTKTSTTHPAMPWITQSEQDNTLGLAYQRDFQADLFNGRILLGGQFEYDAVRGTASSGALSLGKSTQSFFLAPEIQTSALGLQWRLGGSLAVSKVHGLDRYSSIVESIGTLSSSEFYASAQKSSAFQANDLAYLKVWQPEVIESGQITLNMPSLAAPYEAIRLNQEVVSVASNSRPLHLALGYSMRLSKNAEANFEIFALQNGFASDSQNLAGGTLRLTKQF